MCTITIQVQCCDRFFEVIPDEGKGSELFIEEVVSHVLLHLFQEVIVDDVMIRFFPGFHDGLRRCFITIQAQCSCSNFIFPVYSHNAMQCVIKETLFPALKELFVTVKIDDVFLGNAHHECEFMPALF